MTADEAKTVMTIARSGAVDRGLDDAALAFMARQLGPLPFEPTRTRVETYVLSNKWLSSAAELLDAVGMPQQARPMLTRAIQEGGELWPSLRDPAGWEYLPPGAPISRGIVEALHEARVPLPPGRVAVSLLPGSAMRALPARDGDQDEPRRASSTLAVIGGDLRRRKEAALRQAAMAVQHPAPPALPDRSTWHPALLQAVEAAEAAHDQARQAAARCAQQEAAYREMCGRLARQIRDCAPDNEAAKPIAVELLQRLLADPGYGPAAVAEVVRDAVNPALAVARCDVERGPNPDEFADEPGPIVALRLAIR